MLCTCYYRDGSIPVTDPATGIKFQHCCKLPPRGRLWLVASNMTAVRSLVWCRMCPTANGFPELHRPQCQICMAGLPACIRKRSADSCQCCPLISTPITGPGPDFPLRTVGICLQAQVVRGSLHPPFFFICLFLHIFISFMFLRMFVTNVCSSFRYLIPCPLSSSVIYTFILYLT